MKSLSRSTNINKLHTSALQILKSMNFLTTHFPLEVPFSESLFLLRWPLLLIRMKSLMDFHSSPQPWASTKGSLWLSFPLPEQWPWQRAAPEAQQWCPFVPVAGAGRDDPDFHKPPSCREAQPADTVSPWAPRGMGHMTCVWFLPVFLISMPLPSARGTGGEQPSNLTRKTLLLNRHIPEIPSAPWLLGWDNLAVTGLAC